MKALFALILVMLASLGSGCRPSADSETTQSKQYAVDVRETARLVSFYLSNWQQHGRWPTASNFVSTNFVFKGTETNSITHPNRRRDFYRTLYQGGRELDVILMPDGNIDVMVFGPNAD